MEARLADAEVIQSFVRNLQGGAKPSSKAISDYKRSYLALLNDQPKFGPSVSAQFLALKLPTDIHEILPSITGPGAPINVTYLTKAMRSIRDILVERVTTGDPGRHISTKKSLRSNEVTTEYLNDRTEPPAKQYKDRSKVDPSKWTGIESRSSKLKAAQALLPSAQLALVELITHLEQANNNGAPPLDERVQAIEHLRALHAALGKVLKQLDQGNLDDELGDGLVAELARYAGQVKDELKDDPLPYAVAALIYGALTAAGFGGFGGVIAGAALSIKKTKKS